MTMDGQEREIEKGRLALWLDSDDIRWLARHCCCPEDADYSTRERCGRIRFRANVALHKAGYKKQVSSFDAQITYEEGLTVSSEAKNSGPSCASKE